MSSDPNHLDKSESNDFIEVTTAEIASMSSEELRKAVSRSRRVSEFEKESQLTLEMNHLLLEENNHLRSQLEDLKEKKKGTAHENQRLTENPEDDELPRLRLQNESLLTRQLMLEAQVSEAAKYSDFLSSDLSRVEKEVRNLRDHASKLESSNSTLRSQIDEITTQYQNLLKENKLTSSAGASKMETMQELKEENAELTSKSQKLELKSAKRKSKISQLKANVEYLKNRIVELTAKNSQSKEINETAFGHLQDKFAKATGMAGIDSNSISDQYHVPMNQKSNVLETTLSPSSKEQEKLLESLTLEISAIKSSVEHGTLFDYFDKKIKEMQDIRAKQASIQAKRKSMVDDRRLTKIDEDSRAAQSSSSPDSIGSHLNELEWRNYDASFIILSMIFLQKLESAENQLLAKMRDLVDVQEDFAEFKRSSASRTPTTGSRKMSAEAQQLAYQKKLNELEKNLASMNAYIARETAEKTQLIQHIEKLESESTAHLAQLESCKKDLESKQIELEAKLLELDSKEQTIVALNNDMNSIKLAFNNDMNSIKSAFNNDMNSIKSDYESRIVTMQSELEKLQSEITALQSVVELKDSELNEKSVEFSQKTSDYMDKIGQLEDRLGLLAQKDTIIEGKDSIIHSKELIIESKDSMIQEKSIRITSLEESKKKLEEDIVKKQEENEELIAKHKFEVENLKEAHLSALNNVSLQLSVVTDRLNQLEKDKDIEISRLMATLDTKEAELVDKIKKLQEMSLEASSMAKDIQELKQHISQLSSNIETITVEKQAESSARAALEKDVFDLRSSIDNLKNDLNEASKLTEGLKKEKDTVFSQYVELNELHQKTVESEEQLKTQLVQLQSKAKELDLYHKKLPEIADEALDAEERAVTKWLEYTLNKEKANNPQNSISGMIAQLSMGSTTIAPQLSTSIIAKKITHLGDHFKSPSFVGSVINLIKKDAFSDASLAKLEEIELSASESEILKALEDCLLVARNHGIKLYSVSAQQLYQGNRRSIVDFSLEVIRIHATSKTTLRHKPDLNILYLDKDETKLSTKTPDRILLKWANFWIEDYNDKNSHLPPRPPITNLGRDLSDGRVLGIIMAGLHPDWSELADPNAVDLTRKIVGKLQQAVFMRSIPPFLDSPIPIQRGSDIVMTIVLASLLDWNSGLSTSLSRLPVVQQISSTASLLSANSPARSINVRAVAGSNMLESIPSTNKTPAKSMLNVSGSRTNKLQPTTEQFTPSKNEPVVKPVVEENRGWRGILGFR